MTEPMAREDARRAFHEARERVIAAVAAFEAAADQCEKARDVYYGILIAEEFEHAFAEIEAAQ